MDLMELARDYPEMTVSIKLRDLLAANEALVRRVRREVEQEQARLNSQAGDYLITKADARRRLGSPDPSTLWRWERAGYLVPVRIGTKVFYKQADIAGIISRKEQR